jgi:hypothetical protein
LKGQEHNDSSSKKGKRKKEDNDHMRSLSNLKKKKIIEKLVAFLKSEKQETKHENINTSPF